MDRKSFLRKVPLLGVGTGLVLTGCSTGTGTDDSGGSDDLTILLEAAEVEAQAIQTYNAAAGLLSTQAYIDIANLYKSHHEEHLTTFNTLIQTLDGSPINLSDAGPDERAGDLGSDPSEADIIHLAMTLELEAADAYFQQSVAQLQGTNAKLRMGEIFPVEVAHFVTLKGALDAALGLSAANVAGASFVDIKADFTPFPGSYTDS
ncbi:MAG: ferritin-like domain-containing protein [Balneolaceae bacterium]|nr:ferritin-like domain-containing protein [Balneolaceae bacterium]MBO6546390.1 ferritin-like domain-containing protein [Balneolaceae bacterium]MBO6648749.1 ferritin-like domain-containing protein [Balneolaceae bacterium]